MPLCMVVSPQDSSCSKMAGALSRVMPRSWKFCRVVMSPHPPSPASFVIWARMRSCSDVTMPLGSLSRIMN